MTISKNRVKQLLAAMLLFGSINAAGMPVDIGLDEFIIPGAGQNDPRCRMIPDKGPCKAIFWKYHYDAKTNSCKEFMYGGCEGVVPFDTKEECVKFCVEPDEPGFPVKKPAVYLYPKHETDVSVALHVNGSLTKTIPPYRDGWKVRAAPDGIIDRQFDYLFYEANLKTITLPKEGWVVPYPELSGWFDLHLSRLGLNAKEKNQFKEYWLKELPQSPYYAIRLLDSAFLNDNMRLEIHPKPDTLIRLNFHFTPLTHPITIHEPAVHTPERKGFTAVEWGGILENSKTVKVH